ncbi:MAG: hypothetical protein J0I06_21860 [Planctomycetes bacterium]|nr:hypothetical protein [Planctomycetota bacterium]
MTRHLIVTTAILGLAGTASAQYPPYGGYGGYGGYGAGGFGGYNQSPFMPNVYNPQNQPLSPYLNLLRGGNPSVNYYYGVRPGTTGGFGGGIGAPFTAFGGPRPVFFPQLATAPDPLQPREAGVGDVLPPAGHPVVFNNTLGYFPSPFGNRGGMRPGLAGVGTTRPPGR